MSYLFNSLDEAIVLVKRYCSVRFLYIESFETFTSFYIYDKLYFALEKYYNTTNLLCRYEHHLQKRGKNFLNWYNQRIAQFGYLNYNSTALFVYKKILGNIFSKLKHAAEKNTILYIKFYVKTVTGATQIKQTNKKKYIGP